MSEKELEMSKNLYEQFQKENLYVDWLEVKVQEQVDTYTKIKYHMSGDWKHDHLLSRWVVLDFLSKLGYEITTVQQTVTEDTGEDYYPADHYITGRIKNNV